MNGYLDLKPVEQHLAPFTAQWRALREEVTTLNSGWVDHPDRHLTVGGWSIVPVRYFGADDRPASLSAPVLAELVQACPAVITAAYMRLAPGVTLAEHQGNPIGVGRFHLGLVTPAEAWIEVGGDRRTWQPGEWLGFDDTTTHAAGNDALTDRLVLSLDLEHPDVEVSRWARPVRFASRIYYTSVRRFPQLEFLLGRLSPLSTFLKFVHRKSQVAGRFCADTLKSPRGRSTR